MSTNLITEQNSGHTEIVHAYAHLSALEAAKQYRLRGWMPVPIPFREKNPGLMGWPDLRIEVDDLCNHFNGKPQNIGILLGEPSGGLIDIDLDHELAVKLAPEYLPPTPARFGRAGKPLSHWEYYCHEPLSSAKFSSDSDGTIVELRSTGLQTVFPNSTHKDTGELIVWDIENSEPTTLDSRELLDAVKRLANAVRIELGEQPINVPPVKLPLEAARSPIREPLVQASFVEACVTDMKRLRMYDHNDGSNRLFAAACKVVEHNLSDHDGVLAIREYAFGQPFPSDWNDEQILRRIHDAEKRCTRGAKTNPLVPGLTDLGARDPKSGRLILHPKQTLPTAEAYIREFQTHSDGRTLHCYNNLLYEWRGNRFNELEDEAVKHRLQVWLHGAAKLSFNQRTGQYELANYDSNALSVKGILDSIKTYSFLPGSTVAPSWLGEASIYLPQDILPCRSSLIHLPTMTSLPATPSFFSFNALDYDPEPNADPPSLWLNFLNQLFEDDYSSIALLQEWMGYCLASDTSQQKMLLIVGPKRSGKGTIGRILAKLIGIGNVCGPSTSSLAGPFGLQQLLAKSLAIVSDARFHGDNITTVLERLLCITGQDTVTIDRKFLPSITIQLPLKFMFMSNELPRISDASGAIASRFLILRLKNSFYGNEDLMLTERLLVELPGILNWAIEGWRRLREKGSFTLPPSMQETAQELEDLSSPMAAFVRECCDVSPGNRVDVDDLYDAWNVWREREGRQLVITKQTFGRDLSAAATTVIRRRGTGQAPFYDNISLKIGAKW